MIAELPTPPQETLSNGPFWRQNDPLSRDEQILIQLLLNGHLQCTFRNNASTQAFANAAFGSENFANGLIAALASMGGPHAPFKETAEVLEGTRFMVSGVKTPGWGNSFIKGEPDLVWRDMDAHLSRVNPKLWQKIDAITKALHSKGKKVYPNASAYTAATCLTIRLPIELASMFFIQGRVEALAHLFMQNVLGGKG